MRLSGLGRRCQAAEPQGAAAFCSTSAPAGALPLAPALPGSVSWAEKHCVWMLLLCLRRLYLWQTSFPETSELTKPLACVTATPPAIIRMSTISLSPQFRVGHRFWQVGQDWLSDPDVAPAALHRFGELLRSRTSSSALAVWS